MDCDRYLELLSARMEDALVPEEERALEEHLSRCPGCRAAGAQLAALQAGFPELEELEAPADFTQKVIERIRESEKKKVIPLFRRPQVRALAGLAACLVLAVGLYGASRPRHLDKTEQMDVTARSFSRDAEVMDGENPRVNAALVDPEFADAPRIAAYAAPVPEDSGTMGGMQKAAPNPEADGLTESRLSSLELSENTLAMDYLPEGAAELLSPETAVQPYPGGGTVYLDIPKDIYDQIQRLAVEQGMTFSCALTGDGGAENGPFTLIILEE